MNYETEVGFYYIWPIQTGEQINVPLYFNWPSDGDDYEPAADGSTITFNIVIKA